MGATGIDLVAARLTERRTGLPSARLAFDDSPSAAAAPGWISASCARCIAISGVGSSLVRPELAVGPGLAAHVPVSFLRAILRLNRPVRRPIAAGRSTGGCRCRDEVGAPRQAFGRGTGRRRGAAVLSIFIASATPRGSRRFALHRWGGRRLDDGAGSRASSRWLRAAQKNASVILRTQSLRV